MKRSRVKLLLIIFSIIFIGLISALIIFESINYSNNVDKSRNNFKYLENRLIESNISIFISGMKDYYRIMPELLAFRLSNNAEEIIYLFSIPGIEDLLSKADYFDRSNTIYNNYHMSKIKLSNSYYTIQAVYYVQTKNNLYLLLKNISIALFIYLFLIFCLLIYTYSNKTAQIVLQNNNQKAIINKIGNDKNYLPPEQKITDELKKSASFDQDLVLILIGSSENLIKKNESEFLNILNKYFPFNDLIFRYDDNTFGILLPNLDLEKGIQQIEKFDQTFVSSSINTLKFPIMFGLSSRNGRLISGNIILKEAKAALNKAKSDKDFPIIGFRPNPARYREYLSKLKQRGN